MSDRITITYGRVGNAEPIYVMNLGEQMVVGGSVDHLYDQYRRFHLLRDRLLWPSKSMIRTACKIARMDTVNPRDFFAGAALERRGGGWEVVQIEGEGE